MLNQTGGDESVHVAKLSDVDDGPGNHDGTTETGCRSDDWENHSCDAHVPSDQVDDGGVRVP